ncbi:hypothetical protein [Endozoicomonas sp. ONNA1]|uniref:hypothetical protein n=1 Tax=Endozoicomonas sp. ONNA1 TaxID=2828740 RepID=UPI002148FA83|nr:hypothetical protein [Endozoicomonas sp. ONNA1]
MQTFNNLDLLSTLPFTVVERPDYGKSKIVHFSSGVEALQYASEQVRVPVLTSVFYGQNTLAVFMQGEIILSHRHSLNSDYSRPEELMYRRLVKLYPLIDAYTKADLYQLKSNQLVIVPEQDTLLSMVPWKIVDRTGVVKLVAHELKDIKPKLAQLTNSHYLVRWGITHSIWEKGALIEQFNEPEYLDGKPLEKQLVGMHWSLPAQS